ncbi:MAG: hypothetical protein ABI399_02265 [Bauldia sp.]
MPKPLREYNRRDLLRFQPLLHRLKQARYDAVTAIYVRRAGLRGCGEAVRPSLRGRRIMVTVAYEDPEAVAWQSQLLRRFVPDPIHIVADNSHDEDAARAIEAVAASEGRIYLRLPPNPWSGPSASRSHGLALNWLWRNLVRPAEPEAFGFLDDDLFPTGPDDPFAPLARQPVCGGIRSAGPRWFLWPGFCFFRYDAVRRLRLDFGQDWFAGLDTGGGNWRRFYRHLDLAALETRREHYEEIVPGVPAEECSLGWWGSWLHERGTQQRLDLYGAKRAAVKARIARLLAEGPSPAQPHARISAAF